MAEPDQYRVRLEWLAFHSKETLMKQNDWKKLLRMSAATVADS